MNDVVLNLRNFKKNVCLSAWLLGGLFFVSSLAFAAPPSVQPSIEPGITITSNEDDGQITEYRTNGKLYMVKITPAKGPSYYLLDVDGDGVLETRRHRIEGDEMLTPRWKVLQWK